MMKLKPRKKQKHVEGKKLMAKMKHIPINAAKEIAEKYGYDQIVIIGRAVGQGEHVTTYGRNKENCDVAARIGDFLKYKIMGWTKENGCL